MKQRKGETEVNGLLSLLRQALDVLPSYDVGIITGRTYGPYDDEFLLKLARKNQEDKNKVFDARGKEIHIGSLVTVLDLRNWVS